MNEPDENEDQDIAASDIMKISVEVIQETGQDQEKNQKSKNQKNLLPSQEPAKVYDEDDLAKRGFLKLLLRLRRVILQDAAVFLFERRTNKLVHDGEINQDGTINIFATIEFKRFQEELLSQLDNPVDDRLGEYENLVPELVDVQKEFTHRLAGIEGRMAWEQYENQKRHFELQNAMITQQNNMAISQQALHHHYQQILYNQGLLLQNQQILSSQLQMWLAANNFGQTSAPSASAMPTTPMPFIPPMPPTSQPFYPQLSIVQQNFRPPLPPAPIQNLSFSRVHPPTPPSIPSPASISRPLDFVGDLPSSSSSPRPPLSLSVSHSTPTPPTPPPAKKSREKNGMWVVQNPQYKKK
jgi:hypothetical protein